MTSSEAILATLTDHPAGQTFKDLANSGFGENALRSAFTRLVKKGKVYGVGYPRVY